jgi:hypothetical protein
MFVEDGRFLERMIDNYAAHEPHHHILRLLHGAVEADHVGTWINATSRAAREFIAACGLADGSASTDPTASDGRPVRFRWQDWTAVLSSAPSNTIAFDAASGPLLGPEHFAWSMMRLSHSLKSHAAAESETGNSSFDLAREFSMRPPQRVKELLEQTLGEPTWEFVATPYISSGAEHEALHRTLSRFIAVVAFTARAEFYRPWIFGRLLETLQAKEQAGQTALALAIDHGRDLFAFYLLLWTLVLKDRV